MLHRSGGETTPGPTSAQQAGKSSPASATCKVPARTSVSSQRKKAQTLTVQDPRTLQNYRREKLGCKQQGVCRAVTDSSRAQATPLVHSVSDQHQTFLRAHFPKRAPQCQSHTMWDLPALLQSLSKPHPKDDGQTRRLLLPRKMKTTRELRSHSHDLEKPRFCSAHSQPGAHRPCCTLRIQMEPSFHRHSGIIWDESGLCLYREAVELQNT